MDNIRNNIDLDPEMLLALQEMRKANANPMVREIIELREKAEHDEASRIQQALRKGKEDGIAELTFKSAIKCFNKGIAPKDIADILEIKLVDVLRIIEEHREN